MVLQKVSFIMLTLSQGVSVIVVVSLVAVTDVTVVTVEDVVVAELTVVVIDTVVELVAEDVVMELVCELVVFSAQISQVVSQVRAASHVGQNNVSHFAGSRPTRTAHSGMQSE